MNTKIAIVLMVIVSMFTPVMGCGCDTMEKKDVEKKEICPEGYHLECEKICKCYCKPVYPVYPQYMSTYSTEVKKMCCCEMACKCVPDETDDAVPAEPVGKHNFGPTDVSCTAGELVPTQYTYFVNGDRVISEEMPTNVVGPVIVTPAHFCKESLQENNFDDTAKGKRIALWKANHAE